MYSKIFYIPILGLGAFTGFSEAFWRMSCGIIQTGRIDPVVNPGGLSAHAHKIAGASNIGLNSSYEALRAANCTSCEIQADKSAYWTPILYYQHANGSFEEVQANGMTVYYLGRGDNRANIKPFPPGFRMVSGDSGARSYDSANLTYNNARPIADRVSFACLDAAPMKETPGLTHTSCSNGLRAQVHFQSCWDGVNLYKADNSHVAYMSQIDNGVCPPTHPVQFIHLFYEVLYSVDKIHLDGGNYVFSQGDPTGYGFHGDFLNAWDPSVLQSAITQCANTDDGAVEHCAPFSPSLDPKFSDNCPERNPVVAEQVKGVMNKLPGCIKITPGPDRAEKKDTECEGGVIGPTVNPIGKAMELNSTAALAARSAVVPYAEYLANPVSLSVVRKRSRKHHNSTSTSVRSISTSLIPSSIPTTPSSTDGVESFPDGVSIFDLPNGEQRQAIGMDEFRRA